MNYRLRYARTLLHEAIMYNRVECAKILMEAGVHCMVEDARGYIPLHLAESVVSIKLLGSENNINFNHKSRDGVTPLHVVVCYASVECVQLLIEYRASVDTEDDDGMTPLWKALENDRYDCAKILLENGANIECFGSDMTALHRAIEADNERQVKFLVDNGANLMIKNCLGMNAEEWVEACGHVQLLKIIKKNRYPNVKRAR